NPPGFSPIGLGHQSCIYTRLDASNPTCEANLAVFTPTIAIPGPATVAGVLVDSDGKMIALPSGDTVPVTWAHAGTGPNHYSGVRLFEVVTDVTSGVTTLALRHFVITTTRSAVFARSLFVASHSYVLAIDHHVGLPYAA